MTAKKQMTAKQKADFAAKMQAARAAKKASTVLAKKIPALNKAIAAPAVIVPKETGASLSMAQLRKLVPAAFANEPSERVSDKYEFIDTAEIVQRMLKEGFVPVRAMQNRARTEEDVLATRHMIRFRRNGAKALLGEVFPEVGIVNGHNGAVRFEMFGGLYRLVCSNGLVTGAGRQNMVQTRHLGDVSSVIEGSYTIIKETALLADKVKAMQGIKVPQAWLAPFAGNAAALAYGEDHQLAKEPLPLLVPRRAADEADNIWNVFNRVQENIMRGGMAYQSANGRAVHTKGITRVKRDVELNLELWDLAEQVATKLDKGFRKRYEEALLT
jgi:hypothetical protein